MFSKLAVINQTAILLSAVVSTFFLSGCATLSGSAEGISPTSVSIKLANQYPIDVALRNIASSNTEGMTPKEYRNMVVAIHLKAADARYREFRSNLSSEGKGLGLGFDLAVLGLTSGTAFVNGAVAKDLSAAASGFLGAKGVIEKNAYFDKTLPALLAAMEAERLKVKTQITINMRKPILEYPPAIAFLDIEDYQTAASLERAIEQVTSGAKDDRNAAQVKYDASKALASCENPENVQAQTRELRELIVREGDSAEITRARYLAAAKSMGLDQEKTNEELKRDIFQNLSAKYCTTTERSALVNEIKEKLEEINGE